MKAIVIDKPRRLEDIERDVILGTLEHFDGDKRLTAKILGVSLKTIYNRLAVYRGGKALPVRENWTCICGNVNVSIDPVCPKCERVRGLGDEV